MKKLILTALVIALFSCSSDDNTTDTPQQVSQTVFGGGYQRNANNIYVAKIWKNGVATSLTNGNQHASANSVFVTN